MFQVKAGGSPHFSTISGLEQGVWTIVAASIRAFRLDQRGAAHLRNLVGQWMKEEPEDVFTGIFWPEEQPGDDRAGVWLTVNPPFVDAIDQAARSLAGFAAG